MSDEKEWVPPPGDPQEARRLAGELGISPVTARLLLNRGIRSAPDARRFLRPDLDGLHNPFDFEDMRKAVDRIREAQKKSQRIAIFGDYDVDGITAACILTLYFRLHGVPVQTVIPHRTREGYGLSLAAIEKLHASGVNLLITVDCGMTNLNEIARARDLGMHVIVLDHHEQTHVLPPAFAIINPKRTDTRYPFRGLCSSALAFKLSWALSEDLPSAWKRSDRYKEFLVTAFSLVTLATFADVAPLVDENRVFVAFGLDAMRASVNKGLRKLLARTGLRDKPVSGWDVSFKLAPRLNAIGRMGDAADGARLFLSDDDTEIEQILEFSEKANRERQKTEEKILEEAIECVHRQFRTEKDLIIVVHSKDWHKGVVGLVAARLVERFNRPAIVLMSQDGRARGSGRTCGELNLAAALEYAKARMPDLIAGGHAQAVGVDVPLSELDRFRDLVNEAARQQTGCGPLREKLHVDDEIPLHWLTLPLCRELKLLAPFGPSNPEPVLVVRNVKLAGEPRIMKDRHLAFFVQDGTTSLRAVAFKRSDLVDRLCRAPSVDLAFVPQINTFSREQVELHVKDVKFNS